MELSQRNSDENAIEFWAKAYFSLPIADTLSDVLVRIYKEAVANNPDGAIAKDSALAEIVKEIEQKSAGITTAINKDKLSTSLEEADAKRDELIRQLGTLLIGYGAIPIADKKAAAEKLLATYEKYGKSITQESYARESSLIESMLEDFANAMLADAIKALNGVADLLAALRTAQDDFNAANDTATAALTAKGESAYALKKPLLAAINEKLVPYVTAMSAIQPEYADFAAKADVEISKANASVGKKKSASETTAE